MDLAELVIEWLVRRYRVFGALVNLGVVNKLGDLSLQWLFERGLGRTLAGLLVLAAIIAALVGAVGFTNVASGPAVESKAAQAPGVSEIDGYKLDDYRSPVPRSLKGATVIDAGEADKLWDNGKSDVIFIDVFPKPPKPNLPEGTIWREPKHESIAGSYWLANVGFGVLAPKYQKYFSDGLERLTKGDKARRVVFFCLRDCWMSWNAAKRAMGMGYTNVIWFPDGTDGWKDFALPIAEIKPEP